MAMNTPSRDRDCVARRVATSSADRGFTLVELLVASALMTVLLAGLWSLVGTFTSLRTKGERRAAEIRKAIGPLSQIETDLLRVAEPRPAPAADEPESTAGEAARFGGFATAGYATRNQPELRGDSHSLHMTYVLGDLPLDRLAAERFNEEDEEGEPRALEVERQDRVRNVDVLAENRTLPIRDAVELVRVSYGRRYPWIRARESDSRSDNQSTTGLDESMNRFEAPVWVREEAQANDRRIPRHRSSDPADDRGEGVATVHEANPLQPRQAGSLRPLTRSALASQLDPHHPNTAQADELDPRQSEQSNRRHRSRRQTRRRTQLRDVEALEFRYYDGSAWQSRWDSSADGELPVAIELQIWLYGGTSLGPSLEDREFAYQDQMQQPLADRVRDRNQPRETDGQPPTSNRERDPQTRGGESGFIAGRDRRDLDRTPDRDADLRKLVVLRMPQEQSADDSPLRVETSSPTSTATGRDRRGTR